MKRRAVPFTPRVRRTCVPDRLVRAAWDLAGPTVAVDYNRPDATSRKPFFFFSFRHRGCLTGLRGHMDLAGPRKKPHPPATVRILRVLQRQRQRRRQKAPPRLKLLSPRPQTDTIDNTTTLTPLHRLYPLPPKTPT